MSELRQPYTPLGIAEDILDETITINENRQERADHHTAKKSCRSFPQSLRETFSSPASKRDHPQDSEKSFSLQKTSNKQKLRQMSWKFLKNRSFFKVCR